MKPRTTIVWEGPPPTQAELRAIAKAAKAGKLPPGRVTARAATRYDTADARAAYEAFHWGRKPRKVLKFRGHSGPVFELGRLRKVEYETRKGREHAIYVHEFDPPFPRLTGTSGGRLGPILGGRARVTPRGIEH